MIDSRPHHLPKPNPRASRGSAIAGRQVGPWPRHGALLIVTSLAAVVPLIAGCATDLEKRFQAHIDYLASDELQGRGVGSYGIELAAKYIAEQFTQIGLEPTALNGTFFQSVPMTLRRALTKGGRLSFNGVAPTADSDEPLRQERDFMPLSFSSDEAFDAVVVYCGYGIVDAQHNHDDFADVDVTGRAVLICTGEPPSWAVSDGFPSRHAMLRSKVYNAKDRGAVAVLFVNQAPAGGESDDMEPFDGDSPDQYGIPAFEITRSLAQRQLARAGLPSLEELQKQHDTGDSAPVTLKGVRVSGQAGLRRESTAGWNVVGLLRGAGPLKDEAVVIGAHYDHLGIRRPMMRKFKAGKLVHDNPKPQIHNGADDNASGVSGLIEIARMFAAGPRPNRSILFIAFTGEEAGLHGSKHYVKYPVVPLDKTVAMLNMDMIGRLPRGGRAVQVFGANPGTRFSTIVESAGQSVDLAIAPGVDAGGRSDHAPFVQHRIPALHFFTGHHRDYHQPSDDSDRINTRGGAKVTTLVYRVASELATSAERLVFHAARHKSPAPSTGTTTYRVVMGLTPSYVDDDQPGMLVDAVSPQGPADIAGMKAGDRILRINKKLIANIYDYMAATRRNSPGDTVEVVVLRSGNERALQVRLAPAR